MTCKTPLTSELKARRDTLGWSLKDVAERCNIDEQSLDEWECGIGAPRLDALEIWAEALGLKLRLSPASETRRRGLTVDWEGRCVTVDGIPVRLTPMEWKALERLAAVPGELVSHQALFRHLYGEERPYSAQSTAIRVLITKLRRLLPLRIDAQWGRGYVLSDVEPSSPRRSDDGGECRPRPRLPERSSAPREAVLQSPSPPRLLQQLMERSEPAIRRPPVAPVQFVPHRAEELQVIERFLAERGATRCPDVATIERSPLPTLVWDKIKRKWVRPSLTDRAAS